MYIMGVILVTIFVLSCFLADLLCDRKAVCREIEYIHKRLVCSLWKKVPFSS